MPEQPETDTTQGTGNFPSIGELLLPERVGQRLEARSKKHALELISAILADGEPLLAANEVFDTLVNREKLGSTAIGEAAAIPHGRLAQVGEVRIAVITLSEPVDFDAIDGKPVSVLVALLLPEPGDEQQHLALLSAIAQMLSDREFRRVLADTADAEELYEAVHDYPASRAG